MILNLLMVDQCQEYPDLRGGDTGGGGEGVPRAIRGGWVEVHGLVLELMKATG